MTAAVLDSLLAIAIGLGLCAALCQGLGVL